MSFDTWGNVFNHYKFRGHDPSSAAFKADEWEKRKNNSLKRSIKNLQMRVELLEKHSHPPVDILKIVINELNKRQLTRSRDSEA